jgi:tRNA threonylcarbamoyladenosine biosynthesis protein TsaB
MVILTIRTDKPEAEVGLFDGDKQTAYETWLAHRELSVTIHKKMDEMLKAQSKTLQDIKGIVCFKGPGSFTGLRIGLTVGNALAYGLGVPVVGAIGESWVQDGMAALQRDNNNKIALPEYGAEVHITLQKK